MMKTYEIESCVLEEVFKMKRTYDVRLRKVGNSHVITVPSNLISKHKLNIKDFIEVTFYLETKQSTNTDSNPSKKT